MFLSGNKKNSKNANSFIVSGITVCIQNEMVRVVIIYYWVFTQSFFKINYTNFNTTKMKPFLNDNY